MFKLMIFAVLLIPVSAGAEVDTRAAEIEAARTRKAQELQPDVLSPAERALNFIKDKEIVERLTAGIAGFRVKLGGLTTGSGFAFGPEYLRRDLRDGNLYIRASARTSLKAYQLYDIDFRLPHLAGDHVFVNFYAVHRNYPGINYYGQGPDSDKHGRSNYRLEDTSYRVTPGVKLFRHLSLGAGGEYLQVNVGPGTDRRFVSAERIYTPDTTPGIDRQTDFLRGAVFAQFDYRDNPGGPRRGGNYVAQFRYNKDHDAGNFSYRDVHLEVQQYFPFFNERRVIALRAMTELTYQNPNQRVPFYLQPVVGGSDTVRGFRPFRFYGDNSLVLNGEYRWEAFSGLDMALFFDAGKVFQRKSQLNFHNLEASAGFGFRFNTRNNVFMRIDTGFSHEGFQLWLKFDNVF
ncbi:MAG: BamA/TamA family outer membrane protein [Bryobacteraceae bacterium]|nr:BamA/TamA family outer membrane protein [Bryobacterales bacterium]MEB2360897.1 BamA/TamA family outer membrane protein [Bryobacterales bacterium]NUN00841.1 BamA/TamA family outer membrane protein [Bryobacteraceae bacterium]